MFGRRGLNCSFCRKSEAEVAKLVAGPRILLAGPRIYICDRCVAVAQQIMEQSEGRNPRSQALRRAWLQTVRAWWRGHPPSAHRRESAVSL
jgi:ClpX C4-type zinc finger protein